MEETEITKRERKKLNREENKQTSSSPLAKKLVIVCAIVAAAAGFFWLMYSSGSQSTPVETDSPAGPTEISSADHTKGPEDALVTLVEYADFQCPACAAYQPAVAQLAEEFKEDLRVVYRHFPLRSIHKHAQISAQAAEAAADQGAFWEMTELLYAGQDEWSNVRDPRSIFKDYANELTLNVDQFDKYMNSNEARDRVNTDYNSGLSIELNATPTFFVNGVKIENPRGLEPFRQIILSEIAKLKATPEVTQASEATDESQVTPQL